VATQAEFKVFPVLNVDTSGIFYQPAPEEPMVELLFRSRARSMDSYAYRGPPQLQFYREDGLDAEGVMQYREVGRVTISAREPLIFFTPNPRADDGGPEFTLLAVDDGPSGLPIDHVRFLNFTQIPFGCRFLDRDMMIQPGANDAISVEERLTEDLFIGLAIMNETSHRVVLKSRWQFNPGNRHYILLMPPPRAGSFRIRALRVTEFVGEDQRFNRNWTPPVLSSSG
jgi:hypothetical protein